MLSCVSQSYEWEASKAVASEGRHYSGYAFSEADPAFFSVLHQGQSIKRQKTALRTPSSRGRQGVLSSSYSESLSSSSADSSEPERASVSYDDEDSAFSESERQGSGLGV